MIAYDDIASRGAHQPATALCAGIPIEWWHQIDRACDRFFIRRGMNTAPMSFREQTRAACAAARQRSKISNHS